MRTLAVGLWQTEGLQTKRIQVVGVVGVFFLSTGNRSKPRSEPPNPDTFPWNFLGNLHSFKFKTGLPSSFSLQPWKDQVAGSTVSSSFVQLAPTHKRFGSLQPTFVELVKSYWPRGIKGLTTLPPVPEAGSSQHGVQGEPIHSRKASRW